MSTIRPFRLPRRVRAGMVASVLAGTLGSALAPGVAQAQVPAAPGHLTPNVADASQPFTDVLLGWSAVPGASSYEIEVSDTIDFSADVLTDSSTTTSWPLPATVPAADYVWRVRAVTPKAVGAWSEVATFTHSWQDTPQHVRVLASTAVPTVTWDVLPGASFYEVEFSDEDPSGNPMQALPDDHRFTCYTQHTYLAPYGIIAGDKAAPGNESRCAFSFSASATDMLNAFHPKDGLGNPQTWFVRVRGRNGTLTKRTTPFSAAALDCTGVWEAPDGPDASTPDAQPPVPTTVPVYSPVPECSSWSEPQNFQLNALGSDSTPSLPLPAVTGESASPVIRSAGKVTGTPLLTWSPVGRASWYRIYFGRTSDLRSADHVWKTAGTSLMPYVTIPDAVRYYWGVQACRPSDCGPVTVQHVTKIATSPVRALTAKMTPLDATLTWRTQTDAVVSAGALVPATDSEAEAYQVELHRVGTSWPAAPVTVDAARLPGESTSTSTTTLPLGGLADGTYEWRVRAVDQSGFTYPWSVGPRFLRDLTAPTARLAMPQGFSKYQALKVTFSEPVTVPAGAISVRDSAGAAVAGSVRGSGASWTFVPAKPWTTGGTYTFAVAGATDRAGNRVVPVSTVVRATTVADTSSVAVSRTGEPGLWSTRTASDAHAGSYLRTAVTSGVSLRTVVVGSSVAVRACRSPHSGAVTVSVDGRTRATVDLYRSYSGCATVWSTRVTRGQHSVAVTPVRSRNLRTDGSWVGIDAIATT